MNKRAPSQFIRILLAAVCAWWIFWMLVGITFTILQWQSSRAFIKASDRNDWALAERLNRDSNEQAEWITRAIMWGAIYPIAPVLAVFGGYVVYRRLGPR